MRKLKFRAWNKAWDEERIIYSTDETFYDKREFYPFCFPVGFSHYNEDGWTITQFTGLKDINGIEIYEGDLIKMLESIWEVVWDQFNVGFHLVHVKGEGTRVLQASGWDKEVIGNIFQNLN